MITMYLVLVLEDGEWFVYSDDYCFVEASQVECLEFEKEKV
jgi:hypothetical protein